MAKPVAIRVAWITGFTAIIAAFIGAAVIGLLQLLGPSRSQQTITVPEATNSPITMLSTARA